MVYLFTGQMVNEALEIVGINIFELISFFSMADNDLDSNFNITSRRRHVYTILNDLSKFTSHLILKCKGKIKLENPCSHDKYRKYRHGTEYSDPFTSNDIFDLFYT